MPRNIIREKEDFQHYILDYLAGQNGYIIREAKAFSPQYAMDTELLFQFLYATQEDSMKALADLYKEQTHERILTLLNNEITRLSSRTHKPQRGLLDVLKHGIEFDNRIPLKLMYGKPATSFNTENTEKYGKNIFSVMQEVYHKDGERIDLVIFLNGIAIISFELKSNMSGQNVQDAIAQYMYERDHKTRLFMYRAGCLVNFAMDLKEVYMTTELQGKSTRFLPFNKGTEDGGAGNPTNPNEDFNVSYMWESVLQKDMLLELIQKFIFVERKEQLNKKTGKKKISETLIFPRFHQLQCVRKLLADVTEFRSSKNYLIQHSAGSGKTNTIAWLAHRLSSLHDKKEKQIFNNIVIITDRIVVDRQLQDAVLGIEHQEGLIRVMDDKCMSSDLADALDGNTKIIVSTIQKFGHILGAVKGLRKKTFAVIIDEAHSSTSGSNMAAVTHTLANDGEEYLDVEGCILKDIEYNGKQDNISMFAFTATPKAETLQLFGCMNELGQKVAFDLYSMRQAIEEGFILDVLSNYVTYQTYFQLNKIIEDDPLLDTKDAQRQITKFVRLHDTNIRQKVEIIIEHFKNRILENKSRDINLGGAAKAMVITSSREAAVKYKEAFEAYIREKGYTNIRALVAFSGKVKCNEQEYTEPDMNGFSEDKLTEQFDSDDYQVLLVANKYQTGFDQPKLVAMYVDKTLRGIAAVQTLSRLNRQCKPFKKQPFVLDFRNEYDDIKTAFEPYYKSTQLGSPVDVSQIRTLSDRITSYNILVWDDVEAFNALLLKPDVTNRDKIKMEHLVDKALKRFDRYPLEELLEMRATIKSFVRFYTFLIQATSYMDVQMHKKYNFLTYLLNEISIDTSGMHISLKDKISATNFRQKKTGEHSKPELVGEGTIELPTAEPKTVTEEQKERLSELIERINNTNGANFDVDVSIKSLLQVKDILLKSADLRTSAMNNTLSGFKFPFKDALIDALTQGWEHNNEFFSLLLDDNNGGIREDVLKVFVEDVFNELRQQSDHANKNSDTYPHTEEEVLEAAEDIPK